MNKFHGQHKEAAMRIEVDAGVLRLVPRQTLKVRDAAGATVSCREGTIWITEERHPRDVILGPGGSYRLTASGLALLHAFGDATVAFS
jgi:hypothetical protein